MGWWPNGFGDFALSWKPSRSRSAVMSQHRQGQENRRILITIYFDFSIEFLYFSKKS